MKKLISICFAALTMGSMLTLPAQADDDYEEYGSEVERFCAENEDLSSDEDISLVVQNFIGEIEVPTPEDYEALFGIVNQVSAGEDLEDICDDLDD